MREHFLLDPEVVFLNHGSFGACPRPVLDACDAWQRELERNPVAFLARRSADLLYEARVALGRFLGAAADDLVFVTNATTAANAVVESIPLGAGDEILTTDQEYGACINAWRHSASRRGATVVAAPLPLPLDPQAAVTALFDRVTARTRLIALSHITSTTALILPVEAVCERARTLGIPVLIDGAHAPGQIDLDLARLGADYYTGNCHKWLCAPKGAAFLYVARERQGQIAPPVRSWGYCPQVEGHTGFDAYLGRTVFERHWQWQGTRNLAAFLSVPAALSFLEAHDWPTLRRACHLRAVGVWQRLLERYGAAPLSGADRFAQMVAIPLPNRLPMTAESLRETLAARYRIEVPVTEHAGRHFVRVSVQAYNTDADLTALESALCELVPAD